MKESESGLEQAHGGMGHGRCATVLAKDKQLLGSAGWGSMFIPPSCLEVVGRYETNESILTVPAQSEFARLEAELFRQRPLLTQTMVKEVDYATLRLAPITVFGTISQGQSSARAWLAGQKSWDLEMSSTTTSSTPIFRCSALVMIRCRL